MTVENLTTNDKYEFVYNGWVAATDDHDGWTELPVVVKEKQKQLPGKCYVARAWRPIACFWIVISVYYTVYVRIINEDVIEWIGE